MEQRPIFENDTGRLTGDLDRLETKVGKIGLNSPEAALSILEDMDSINVRVEALENESSRKQATAQLSGIAGRLRSESGPFLRDLGGITALKKARETAHPPEDHWWWYLDTYLTRKSKASLKRLLITLAIVAGVLVILGLVYNTFLAPDPKVAARYRYEQSARSALISGDINEALGNISQGLSLTPDDPTLLALRGVVEERQGNLSAAQQDYTASEKGFGSHETFLLTRGQAYSLVGMQEKALADAAGVIQANPKSAEAYLLQGSAYESLQQYRQAVDAYDQGFNAASDSGQTELAAMAKMRAAMVMQLIGSQPLETGQPNTPTP